MQGKGKQVGQVKVGGQVGQVGKVEVKGQEENDQEGMNKDKENCMVRRVNGVISKDSEKEKGDQLK